jgi:hypothetical protein
MHPMRCSSFVYLNEVTFLLTIDDSLETEILKEMSRFFSHLLVVKGGFALVACSLKTFPSRIVSLFTMDFDSAISLWGEKQQQ